MNKNGNIPAPKPHRFTTVEYHRMGETGVLKPDDRVELLDGQIHDMSPIGPSHGSVVKRLIDLFTTASKGRWLVAAQDPVVLDTHSEPQPDITLLRRVPDFYNRRHPEPEDIFLLIEVSDSSLAYDRDRKLPAYCRSGIRELWIVNLVDETLEVHREPHVGGYRSTKILRAGQKVRPLAFPDVAIDVAELLGH